MLSFSVMVTVVMLTEVPWIVSVVVKDFLYIEMRAVHHILTHCYGLKSETSPDLNAGRLIVKSLPVHLVTAELKQPVGEERRRGLSGSCINNKSCWSCRV